MPLELSPVVSTAKDAYDTTAELMRKRVARSLAYRFLHALRRLTGQSEVPLFKDAEKVKDEKKVKGVKCE